MTTTSNHLRELIAQALFRESFGLTTRSSVLRQADAIIETLGFKTEFREGDWLLNGQFVPPASRYVSKWVTSDDD